jgi:hypothetical protein
MLNATTDMNQFNIKFLLTSSGIVVGCEALPFLLGLDGSEGPSLTSDMLNRRSPLPRRWNRTLRRDLDMMGGKGKKGGRGGGVKKEWRDLRPDQKEEEEWSWQVHELM